MAASAAASLRQERRVLAADLREEHKTWVEIAKIFADRYGVNMRVAFRLSHDWSQRQAAEAWNQRWPADMKTFKNFSYWEQWPATTGYAPSLEVLARLAELYHCSVADLLTDCADFRPRDQAHRARSQFELLSMEFDGGASAGTVTSEARTSGQNVAVGTDTDASNGSSQRIGRLVEQIETLPVDRLARTIAAWTTQVAPAIDRRDLLVKLSAALTLAAGSAALAVIDEDDPPPDMAALGFDLSGIWHSRYVYYSSSRREQQVGEHYVVLRHQEGKLIGESVRATNESILRFDLVVRGTVATGTWSERTSPSGYYRGRTYHGAIQLVLDPMGKAMKGKWVGVDRDFKVNSDDWELHWVETATKKAQRDYRLKA